MAAPVLLLSASFLFGARRLHGIDFEHLFGPLATVAQAAFARGYEFPRWNPFQYAGVPYAGNPLWNLYYPPCWAFLVLSPERGFECVVVVHLLMASWGMYRLIRSFGRSRLACVLAGITYALSYSMTARIWAGHVPMLCVYGLAPLFLFLLLKTLKAPTLSAIAALGTCAGALLLGGHPQFIYDLVLIAAGFTIAGLWGRARRREAWIPSGGVVLGSVVLGAMISAVHLLPSLETVAWATQGRAELVNPGGAIPIREVLLPVNLFSFLIPRFPWSGGLPGWTDAKLWNEKATYIGIFPLFLSILAMIRQPRGIVLALGMIGGLAFFNGMALHLPLHAVYSLFPGTSGFRVPARTVWVTTLCGAALVGFGWDALAEGREAVRNRRWAFRIVSGLLAVAVLIFAIRFKTWPEATLCLALIAASIALIEIRPRQPVLAAMATFMVIGDLYGVDVSRLTTLTSEEYRRPPWYSRFIGPERNDFRILDLTDSSQKPMAHGFRLLSGYGRPRPNSLVDFYRKAWEESYDSSPDVLPQGSTISHPAILQILNVRWIVTGGSLPYPGCQELGREGPLTVYEDPGARPYAFLPQPGGEVRWTRTGTDRVDLEVRTNAAGGLIVNESWMPGWKAVTQGNPMVLRRAYGVLMEIEVPSGESKIVLAYDPWSGKMGLMLSALGLLVLATLVALRIFSRFGDQVNRTLPNQGMSFLVHGTAPQSGEGPTPGRTIPPGSGGESRSNYGDSLVAHSSHLGWVSSYSWTLPSLRSTLPPRCSP